MPQTCPDGFAAIANARDRKERLMDIEPSEQPPAKTGSSVARGISELLRTVLLAAIVFVGARTVVLPYQVEGASMTPNLHNNERVLVNRTVNFHIDVNSLVNWIPGVNLEGTDEVYPFHPPQRGDVVVLHPPVANSSQPYIKRVIGLAGDTITFDSGYVYINGVKLDELYINGAITDCENGPNCSVTVPDGYVYVLGDNRQNSSDSRVFGIVKIEEIVGKAWFTNWPLTDIGLVPHYKYPDEN
jgi:signal peptidase I